jgi:hypothetical protein
MNLIMNDSIIKLINSCEYFYHSTSLDNLESIKAEGLRLDSLQQSE